MGVCEEDFAGPRSVCVLAGTFLGPHKQVFEAMVLRLSLRILMRSTGHVVVPVERFCVPCAEMGVADTLSATLPRCARRLLCSKAGNTASER